MKSLLIFAVSLTCLNAQAKFLKEGSYLGTYMGEEKVHFMTRHAQNRDGSFFAVLTKDEKKLSLYLVDLTSDNSYIMTPLEITQNGEIGIKNDDPSLRIVENSNGFSIMSANSSNTKGFLGNLIFKDKSSPIKWIDVKSGEYALGKNDKALSISQFDLEDRSANAIFLTSWFWDSVSINRLLPIDAP